MTDTKKKEDAVNHPSHYKIFPDDDHYPSEAIDIIEKVLSYREFVGFLKGNALKYRLRAGFKDALEQDIGKAMWYQTKLFKFVEESSV